MKRRQFVCLPSHPDYETAVRYIESKGIVNWEIHQGPDGWYRGSGEIEVSEDSNNEERTA